MIVVLATPVLDPQQKKYVTRASSFVPRKVVLTLLTLKQLATSVLWAARTLKRFRIDLEGFEMVRLKIVNVIVQFVITSRIFRLDIAVDLVGALSDLWPTGVFRSAA